MDRAELMEININGKYIKLPNKWVHLTAISLCSWRQVTLVVRAMMKKIKSSKCCF